MANMQHRCVSPAGMAGEMRGRMTPGGLCDVCDRPSRFLTSALALSSLKLRNGKPERLNSDYAGLPRLPLSFLVPFLE